MKINALLLSAGLLTASHIAYAAAPAYTVAAYLNTATLYNAGEGISYPIFTHYIFSDLNNSNQAAGYISPDTPFGYSSASTPFLFSSTGTITYLPVVYGPNAPYDFQPNAINNQGTVIGSYNDRQGDHGAVIWKNGSLVNVTPAGPGAFDYTAFSDINNNDQIVGSQNSRATIWNSEYQATILSQDNSGAAAINNLGDVVGQNLSVATLWTQGMQVNLGTLGGTSSIARDINDGGVIAGSSKTDISYTGYWDTEFYTHATFWIDGEIHDLGSLYGSNSDSEALSINIHGQIVGKSGGLAGYDNGLATLWQDGQIFDLNTLLVGQDLNIRLYQADVINDNGWIIASGYSTNGYGSFLLAPITGAVPEPSTYALLLFGLGWTGVMAHRRKSRKNLN